METEAAKKRVLTIDKFCSWFANKYQKFDYRGMEIKTLASDFSNMFQLKYPLTADQLVKVCFNSSYEVETFKEGRKSRGFNFTLGEKVVICFKENDSPTGQIHSLLHELFEIIDKRLWPFSTGDYRKPKGILELDADQFAAYVHLPDGKVFEWITNNGFDVFGLKELTNCSYATALIRFNEVLCNITPQSTNEYVPVIGILYERPYWENQSSVRMPRLQLKHYTKSRGFTFRLQRTELNELLFSSPRTHDLTISKLISVFSKSRANILLQNFKMTFKGRDLMVDVLVRTVNWHRYKGTAKILIQIIPSEHSYLRDLADNLNFKKENMA